MKRRLIIMVTAPVQNQIPEYVYYLAREVRKLGGIFYIAVNGAADKKSYDKLQDICDKIVLRENKDYDVGAYRDIVLGQAEMKKLADYEELVLFNDSFYGPIYPLTDIFKAMECKEVDFWGLSAHPKTEVRPQYFIEEHLQSFFLVVRENMLHSIAFLKFWMDLPSKIASRELAIECFEKKFTCYFTKLGYSWTAYIDPAIFSDEKIKLNYNPYIFSSLELLEKYRFPILKRSVVPFKSMERVANWDDARKCLQFIDKETDYNIGLIWDDLLKRFDINMLKNYFHLTYIVDSNQVMDTEKKFQGIKKNLLIILHGWNKQEQLPPYIYHIADVIQDGEYVVLSKKNIKKYQYICFLNFKDIGGEISYCDKRTMNRNLFENLIKDEKYILYITDLFEQDTRLGALFYTDPYFSDIFNTFRKEGWMNGGWAKMEEISKKKEYHCVVSQEWMPEIGTGSFWCRADILEQEKGFQLLTEILKQNTGWIHCFPYLCQHSGYLVGEVLSAACASEKLCNYKYILSSFIDIGHEIKSKGLYGYYIQLCKQFMRPQVAAFCGKYETIYIYGAGAYGAIFADLLDQEQIVYEGVLISRGQYKPDKVFGKHTYYLDELELGTRQNKNWDKSKVGILAAVPPQVQPVILELCRSQGYWNVYCFEARIANK